MLSALQNWHFDNTSNNRKIMYKAP